ncbi:MAG: thioesterase family protein [Candidatus Omnitrophica bacterium]|nr:thioesterase family protein [Candidatus Omnitrophota bacterium]
MKITIYYHDTDCGGVVYYANYLKYLEEARTEFFAQKGLSVKELAQQGTLFVVARQEIDYKLPASYGDILEIETRVSNISRVSMDFTYEIKNQNGQPVSQAKTILICVGSDLKPKSIPGDIRTKLS